MKIKYLGEKKPVRGKKIHIYINIYENGQQNPWKNTEYLNSGYRQMMVIHATNNTKLIFSDYHYHKHTTLKFFVISQLHQRKYEDQPENPSSLGNLLPRQQNLYRLNQQEDQCKRKGISKHD